MEPHTWRHGLGCWNVDFYSYVFYFVVEKVSMPGSGDWGCKWLMFLYWEAVLTVACSYFMDSGVIGLSFLHHFSKVSWAIITKQRSRLGWVWDTELFPTLVCPQLRSFLSSLGSWSGSWPPTAQYLGCQQNDSSPASCPFSGERTVCFWKVLALTSVGKNPKLTLFQCRLP